MHTHKMHFKTSLPWQVHCQTTTHEHKHIFKDWYSVTTKTIRVHRVMEKWNEHTLKNIVLKCICFDVEFANESFFPNSTTKLYFRLISTSTLSTYTLKFLFDPYLWQIKNAINYYTYNFFWLSVNPPIVFIWSKDKFSNQVLWQNVKSPAVLFILS